MLRGGFPNYGRGVIPGYFDRLSGLGNDLGGESQGRSSGVEILVIADVISALSDTPLAMTTVVRSLVQVNDEITVFNGQMKGGVPKMDVKVASVKYNWVTDQPFFYGTYIFGNGQWRGMWQIISANER